MVTNPSFIKANIKAAASIPHIGEVVHVPNTKTPQLLTGIDSYRLIRGRVRILYTSQPQTKRYIHPICPTECQQIEWSHRVDQHEKLDGYASGDIYSTNHQQFRIISLRCIRFEQDQVIVQAWALPLEVADVPPKERLAV